MSTDADDRPTHVFDGYDANPGICRVCGAVRPMPCYRVRVPSPVAEASPMERMAAALAACDQLVNGEDDSAERQELEDAARAVLAEARP